MQDLEFSEIVGLICKEDTRFDRKAYNFVRQALDHTVKETKKKHPERTGKSQHVTGAECGVCGWVVSDRASFCPWCAADIHEDRVSSPVPLRAPKGDRKSVV